MTDRPIGPGHNRPLATPAFELRRSRVSCDWTHPKKGYGRPRRFESYWRLYKDGALIDSFLKKANAMTKLRRLKAEAAADG
jgi:hypothetical protein